MSKITMYGADWCGDCQRAKQWFKNNDIDYKFIDTEIEKNRKKMIELTDGNKSIPSIKIGDTWLIEPSNKELHDAVYGNAADTAEEPNDKAAATSGVYDIVGIGAGPTSLSAAVYTTRENLKTLLIEKGVVGGLAAVTDMVDNYPGFPEGVTGLDLAQKLEAQAKRFGTEFTLDQVDSLERTSDGTIALKTAMGENYKAKAVLIGTGSEYNKLQIPGEDEMFGRGVHYCATCDGAFYNDKELVVIGSGNSAAQEALFLTRFASKITVLIRGDHWKASDVLVEDVQKNKKIATIFNAPTKEILHKDNQLTAIVYTDKTTDKDVEFKTDGVFVFIGLLPNSQFLIGSGIELDEAGFVVTDQNLMTSVEGVFCSGDVRSGATMQIASAVGEGATAALKIREYLESK